MARLNIERDTEAEDAGGGDFDLVPNGWYTAEVREASYVETKKSKEAGTGDGFYVKLMWSVTEGAHKGRVLFATLNVKNANPKAATIGKSQLRQLEKAMGLQPIDDTDELEGKPVSIKVRTKAAENGYPAGNEVCGFKALEGGSDAGGFAGNF
jgi:hypothetical protein